jgi:hypothetical protein
MSRDSVSSFFSEAIVFVEALFFDLPLAFEALAFPSGPRLRLSWFCLPREKHTGVHSRRSKRKRR